MGVPQVEQYIFGFLPKVWGQVLQSETDDSVCMFPLMSRNEAVNQCQ